MPKKLIALGDSLTYGYPFGNKYSWVELVSQKLGTPIENSGINGNTLRDMYQRLLFDVIDVKPDYVLLMGGANDVYQGYKAENLEQNFLKITQALEDHKIAPIVLLPPPVEEKSLEAILDEFRNFLKKTAKKRKWSLIDLYQPFLDPKKKTKRIQAGLLEDGVHPSANGYRLMADTVYPALNKLLK